MKHIFMATISLMVLTTASYTASAEGFLRDKVIKFQSMSNEEKAAAGQQIQSNWDGLSEEQKAAVASSVQAKGQQAAEKWNSLPAEQQQQMLDAAHLKAQEGAAKAKAKWDSIPDETKQQAAEKAKAKWSAVPAEQKAQARAIASEKAQGAKTRLQGRFGQE